MASCPTHDLILDFQQLVSDAFSLPDPPLLLASPVQSLDPFRSPDHDERELLPVGGRENTAADDEAESLEPLGCSAKSIRDRADRRSSASCTASMEFSAPSPSPTDLFRRRRQSSFSAPNLDPPPAALKTFASTPSFSKPPPAAVSHKTEPSGMPDASFHTTPRSLQPQRRAVVERPLPAKSPANGGFFRTLKTRASHLLLRAAHPSPRPRTGIVTVQTEDLDEATNLLGHAHPSATLDPSYVFPPRRLDGIAASQDQADEVFSSPVSPFSPHAKANASSTCCPFPLPNPLTPTSPPRNIKPGRYATSPKTRVNAGIQPSEHVQKGSLTVADAELSRSLLQMGLAQEPSQHRERRKAKRTSSVPLDVLCSIDALGEAAVKKAHDVSERAVQDAALPTPPGTPRNADHGQRVKTRRRSTSDASIAPSHPLAFNGLVPPLPGSIQTTTHEDTRERNNTRRRSASDASMAPLRPPFSPPSPQNPVPASPAELARHTKHESVKDQLGDLPNLSWTRHGNPSSTPQFFRIHTRLPPLSAIRAHCFSNPYEPLNAGAFKFGSPLIGGSDVDPAPPCSVFTEARRQDEVGEDRGGQGIVSLGLGIEFYEDELNSRCPSPYMNPRPAPAPPLVLEPRGVEVERRGKADAEVDIDDEELKVPDYVFERRGSATSQATTSSGRSTKTLKERLTSFVTLSTKPYTSSVWSLKQPSHSRSKLNLTLVAPSPSPLNQPVTSSSTSTTTPGLVHPKADASPHAKSTRSYKSNSTVLTQSTSESSEFLNTPRTPASGLYRYPPSTPPVRSFAGHGLSSSPPSAFNTGMSSGSPSRSSKLMKRSSYTSRLYPMQSKLGSRSELSLALGMGMGLGAGTGARDSMGCFDGGEVDKETEEEARAIGRVLTPEVDPFMRMPMGATAYMPERRSVRGGSAGGSVVAESEESLVASEETFVSADENCGMDELGGGTSEGGHALTSSRDSVAPAVGNLNSVARMRARERGIESRLTFGSSLEGCSSPPPRYSRLSPGPSAYTHTLPQILHSTFSSESSSSLSLVIPEDSTCGIPDSPVLPSASPLPSPSTPRLSYSSPPLSASELPPTPTLTQSTSPLAPSPPPILSPLSPMSTLSFTFLQDL